MPTVIGQAEIAIRAATAGFEADARKKLEQTFRTKPLQVKIVLDTTQVQAELKKIQADLSLNLKVEVEGGGGVGKLEESIAALTSSLGTSLAQVNTSLTQTVALLEKLAKASIIQSFGAIGQSVGGLIKVFNFLNDRGITFNGTLNALRTGGFKGLLDSFRKTKVAAKDVGNAINLEGIDTQKVEDRPPVRRRLPVIGSGNGDVQRELLGLADAARQAKVALQGISGGGGGIIGGSGRGVRTTGIPGGSRLATDADKKIAGIAGPAKETTKQLNFLQRGLENLRQPFQTVEREGEKAGESVGGMGNIARTAFHQFQRGAGVLQITGTLMQNLPGPAKSVGRALVTAGTLAEGAGVAARIAALGFSGMASAALVGKFGLDAIVGITKNLVASFSALNEQLSAVGFQFGSAAGTVKTFAATASDTIGLSESATLKASLAFGGLFSNVGVGEQAVADLSTGFLQLAGDLASFRDIAGGAEEASRILISGLIGETEPLRRIGVVFTDFEVTQKAMALTGVTTSKAIDQQTKVLARGAIAMEQLNKASGDFVRTSQSIANLQRSLAAAKENASAGLGEAFAPFARLNLIINKALVGTVAFFRESFGDIGKALDSTFQGVVDALAPVGASLIFVFGVLKLFGRVGGAAFQVIGAVIGTVGKIIRTATDLVILSIQKLQSIPILGKLITKVFGEVGGAAEQAQLDFGALAKESADLFKSPEKFVQNVVKAIDAQFGVNKALSEMDAATKTYEDARIKVADLTIEFERFGHGGRAVLEAQEKAAKATRDHERAQIALRESTRGLLRVQQDSALAQEETNNLLQGYAKDSREATEAQLAFNAAVIGTGQSELALVQAQNAVGDSAEDAAEATRKMNGVLHGFDATSKEGIQNTRAYEDALQSQLRAQIALEQSLLSLTEAQEGEERAKKRSALVSKLFGETSRVAVLAARDAKKAQLAAQEAAISQTDASRGPLRAAQDLAEAQKAAFGFPEGSREAIEARRAARDADLAMSSAKLGLASAENSLASSRLNEAKATEELDIKLNGLNATNAVTIAQRKELLGAQRTIEDAADQIRSAELALEDATAAVPIAGRAAEDAQFELSKTIREGPGQAIRDMTEAVNQMDEAFIGKIKVLGENLATLTKHFTGKTGVNDATEFFNSQLGDMAKNLQPGSAIQNEVKGFGGKVDELTAKIKEEKKLDVNVSPAKQSINGLVEFVKQKAVDISNTLTDAFNVNMVASLSAPDPNTGEVRILVKDREKRAFGGPVSAGRQYLVGEAGTELFIPNQSGFIVSNRNLAQAAEQASQALVEQSRAVLQAMKDLVAVSALSSSTNTNGDRDKRGVFPGGQGAIIVMDGEVVGRLVFPHIRRMNETLSR